MPVYEVGQPYHPHRKIWEQTPQFNLRGGEAELLLFLDRPTPEEVQAVKSSPAEFGLYHQTDQVVLCYRFDPGIPWSDAPFTIHRVPVTERVVPDPDALGPETRAVLSIALVNARGGEIRALRSVTLSPAFTRALYTAVRDQAAIPWDPGAYDRELDRLFARYSPTVFPACAITTTGGA